MTLIISCSDDIRVVTKRQLATFSNSNWYKAWLEDDFRDSKMPKCQRRVFHVSTKNMKAEDDIDCSMCI